MASPIFPFPCCFPLFSPPYIYGESSSMMVPAAFSITRPILLHIVCLLSTHTPTHTIAILLKNIGKKLERGKSKEKKIGGKMPQSTIRDDGNFTKNFSFPLTLYEWRPHTDTHMHTHVGGLLRVCALRKTLRNKCINLMNNNKALVHL